MITKSSDVKDRAKIELLDEPFSRIYDVMMRELIQDFFNPQIFMTCAIHPGWYVSSELPKLAGESIRALWFVGQIRATFFERAQFKLLPRLTHLFQVLISYLDVGINNCELVGIKATLDGKPVWIIPESYDPINCEGPYIQAQIAMRIITRD